MQNRSLSDLFSMLMETMRPPDTPERRAAGKRFAELEKQFLETMGYDLVMEYQTVCDQLSSWEKEAAFLAGLRFSAQYMLSVLPYSSDPAAAP